MARTYFDQEKALNVLLFVIQQLGKPGYHKAFKTLYFAEQQYLTTYGASLMGGDRFVKMKDGPVPTHIYDFVKLANGKYQGHAYGPEFTEQVKASIAPHDRHQMVALIGPDLDFLAPAEAEVLYNSARMCAPLTYAQLRDMSHDRAWHSVEYNEIIEPVAIAAAAGATPEQLDYLREVLNNDYYASL